MAIGTPTSIGSATENSADTNVALTLAAAVSIGDLIVVAFAADENRAPSSITDSKSHTYQLDKTITNSVLAIFSGRFISLYSTVCTSAMTTSDTITATHDGAGGTVKTVCAFKVSGSWNASRLDKTASGTGSTAAWSSGATAATAVADELVVGASAITDTVARTSTPGTGYTELFDRFDTDLGTTVEYKIVAATGAQTADGTWSAANQWAAVVATYKEASGGSTYTKTSTAILGLTGSGADAMTFVETGTGIVSLTGSGADFVTFVETGMAVLGLTGSGAKQMGGGVTYTKDGAAILGFTASGVKVVTYTETGIGVLGLTGSGARVGGTVSATVVYDTQRDQFVVIYYYNQ